MNNLKQTTWSKQIVIISGKGGTGKTTLAAALADLAENRLVADCDVDAADLHILLKPEITDVNPFTGAKKAYINQALCSECGLCEEYCRFDAIENFKVDTIACEGCGFCVRICPEKAIDFNEHVSGFYQKGAFDDSDFFGAYLQPGEGNSGKLVSQVKKSALNQVKTKQREWYIIDGPPGIGCPVNASLNGADLILVVTEPTVSGVHDLQRVIQVALQFKIPVAIVINKCDLNPQIAREITQYAAQNQFPVFGKIPFDEQVVRALMHGHLITRYPDSLACKEIRNIWSNIERYFISGARDDQVFEK
ncbi:MAG: ATP-binding protein [Calditrichia bacterium]